MKREKEKNFLCLSLSCSLFVLFVWRDIQGEQKFSMSSSLKWTFLCVVFSRSAHNPYFMNRYVQREWKEKFIHFTHSHNWAAHERMNWIKRSFHQVKLFPPLAFASRFDERMKPSGKGDTFVIMKMAAKSSHLFIITGIKLARAED